LENKKKGRRKGIRIKYEEKEEGKRKKNNKIRREREGHGLGREGGGKGE
jgi:hypothetical protein